MDAAKQPWYRWLFTLTWQGAYQWLVGIALGLISAWLFQRKMPSAIAHPAEYWLFTSAVFFSSFISVLALAQGMIWSLGGLLTLCNPPELIITAHGGRTASVELQHSGVSTRWEARIRIIEFSGDPFNRNPPNPNPLLHQAYLEKDGVSHRELRLADGETASITLGEVRRSHYTSNRPEIWTEIPNADDEHGTRMIGDATIELNLSTKPARKKFSLKRCFKISQAGGAMECMEVPCR